MEEEEDKENCPPGPDAVGAVPEQQEASIAMEEGDRQDITEYTFNYSAREEPDQHLSDYSLDKEEFDFDLDLSPNSNQTDDECNKEDEEDKDEEIFFGPVGHTERCIAKVVAAASPARVGPLKPSEWAQIVVEAHKVASILSTQKDPPGSSSAGEGPAGSLKGAPSEIDAPLPCTVSIPGSGKSDSSEPKCPGTYTKQPKTQKRPTHPSSSSSPGPSPPRVHQRTETFTLSVEEERKQPLKVRRSLPIVDSSPQPKVRQMRLAPPSKQALPFKMAPPSRLAPPSKLALSTKFAAPSKLGLPSKIAPPSEPTPPPEPSLPFKVGPSSKLALPSNLAAQSKVAPPSKLAPSSKLAPPSEPAPPPSNLAAPSKASSRLPKGRAIPALRREPSLRRSGSTIPKPGSQPAEVSRGTESDPAMLKENAGSAATLETGVMQPARQLGIPVKGSNGGTRGPVTRMHLLPPGQLQKVTLAATRAKMAAGSGVRKGPLKALNLPGLNTSVQDNSLVKETAPVMETPMKLGRALHPRTLSTSFSSSQAKSSDSSCGTPSSAKRHSFIPTPSQFNSSMSSASPMSARSRESHPSSSSYGSSSVTDSSFESSFLAKNRGQPPVQNTPDVPRHAKSAWSPVVRPKPITLEDEIIVCTKRSNKV